MTHRQRIEDLLDQYTERFSDRFLSIVDGLKSEASIQAIVSRLERGDVDGAIEVLGLDPVAFDRLQTILVESYEDGGNAEVGNLPLLRDPDGARVLFRFGVRNTEGERRLREQSSQLITRIAEDQRTAVRETLSEGLAAGRNPRSTALDVVGRVSRVSNTRQGGIIGLSAPQARYARSARAELSSGDPEQLRHYLTRTRRDRRFDAAVEKAIRDGKPVPAEQATRMVMRYEARLLQLRGETIARTETLQALNMGRDEALQQQIDAGKIAAQGVTKIWRSARDERVRGTHRGLNGQQVAKGEAFVSPSGARLRYPGDPEASAREIVACRCVAEYKVDYLASVVRQNRRG